MYKRRSVPVIRDFPEGCGVYPPRNVSNAESKIGTVLAVRDFPAFFSISNHRSETVTSRVEEIYYSCDTASDESVIEVELNGDLSSPCSTRESKTRSPVKKRRLSFHDSESGVVDSSVRLIVSGLAAKSKCPWSQPKKKHGSRREKRSLFL